jgi:hypothetical protein
VHLYNDWLTSDDRAGLAAGDHAPRDRSSALPSMAWQGEHAHAGALRFFATGTLDDEPHAEAVLQRYPSQRY